MEVVIEEQQPHYLHKNTNYPITQAQKQTPLYRNFINSLNSNVTRRSCDRALNRFMAINNIQEIDQLVQLPLKEVETLIINTITEMQQVEELSVSSVNMTLNSLLHFYSMNDITLNWKKIRKFVKTDVPKKTKDKAYSHEDIKKLLAISDLRMRMIFLVFASTGIRADALHSIKLRNLTKIDSLNIYKVVIYEGYLS